MLVKRKRINPYNERQRGLDGTPYNWPPPDKSNLSVTELPDDFARFLIRDCPDDYAEYVPAPPSLDVPNCKAKGLADYGIDPARFAARTMQRYADECAEMWEAQCKVRSVP